MKTANNSRKYSIPLIYGVFLFVFVCWFTYRYITHFNDITDELVAKPLIWIIPIIVVTSTHLRKNFFSLFSLKNLTWKTTFLGIIGGVFLTLLQVIPLMMNGQAQFHIPVGLLGLTLATIGTAVSEEIFFRGFLFKQLQGYYSTAINIIINSLLFSTIHIPILLVISHYSGTSLFGALYIIFASSLVFCGFYSYSKNLWVAIIAHFVMDFLLLIF